MSRAPMSVEEARSLVRKSLERLPHSAVARLLQGASVDDLNLAECEWLAGLVARWWQERTADPCVVCRLPVRQEHGHAILDGQLFHSSCVPPARLHDSAQKAEQQ